LRVAGLRWPPRVTGRRQRERPGPCSGSVLPCLLQGPALADAAWLVALALRDYGAPRITGGSGRLSHMPAPTAASPAASVRVDPGPLVDYWFATSVCGGGLDTWFAWEALASVLYGRQGWHCEIVNDLVLGWLYGDLGSSLLFIGLEIVQDRTPYDDAVVQVRLHDHDNEENSVQFLTSEQGWLEAVSQWVEQRGDAIPLPTRGVTAMVSADDWNLLRNHLFDCTVIHDGDEFLATVEGFPGEVATAPDLPGAVVGARQLVANFYGAPVEIAASLNLSVHLDAASSRLLAAEA